MGTGGAGASGEAAQHERGGACEMSCIWQGRRSVAAGWVPASGVWGICTVTSVFYLLPATCMPTWDAAVLNRHSY